MSGPIPIENGGTGASTASGARFNLGINIDSNRIYSSQSLSFGSGRTPSATNDILVIASVQMSITALQTSTITVQVDTGSGFVTIGTVSLSGIAITDTKIITFIVPVNSQYKLVSSGTGTNNISSVFELTL